MSVSLGPFLTCFVTVLVLTAYIYFIVHVKKDVLYGGMKLAFFVIALILIRMLIPFNFPFTITVSSTRILPAISRVLFRYIGDLGFGLAEILVCIWGIVALWRVIYFIATEIKIRKYLETFRVKDLKQCPNIYKALEMCGEPGFPVCIVPTKISPCITGLRKPVLVLPDLEFTDRELYYICRHELGHYKKHDLWLKLFLNLVTCIQWFNPVSRLLNRELTLAFELTNDSLVIKDCDERECLEYAECLVDLSHKLDGENEEVLGIPFVKKKKSYLKIRIQYILEGKLKVSLENQFSQMVCYGIIVLMLIISFVFVPEAYKTTEAENEETFYVSKENAYFIKCDEEYKLYVEGKYMCSLSPIPEEFEEVPIINEEDLK